MSGRVYLVGAGPGDPGLLTARALELIATADVILHDRLIPGAALDGARPDAELLFVGKQGGGASVPQEQTEALMVARAQAGKTIVRLKGGDPLVFGRGGEEALTLRGAGIPYEIVPGVTAGVAAPAYAGIPVTHRGLSTAVAFVTGHTRADGETAGAGAGAGAGNACEQPGAEEADLDWPALAAFPGTLVFYMGVRGLGHIASSLIAAGRSASEPAAVVEAGTLPAQRTVSASLATIAQSALEQNIGAPAITVVGPVAALAEQLAWLPARPLAGRTVAVTRARSQASGLARRLEGLGARVVQAPVIKSRALPVRPLDPSRYDLICVTSANGVEALFESLGAGGRDARSLAGARVAAIGPGTAAALAGRGIVADVTPDRSVAEGLVDALAEVPAERALVARGSEGRDVLPDALRERGADVDVLALYETVVEPVPSALLAEAQAADYVTFTSSSTVRFFLQAAAETDRAGSAQRASGARVARRPGGISERTRIVSIGPVTSETLREHGLPPDVEAARHDIDGVLDALLADAGASER